jgi:hypothetical protein
MKVTALVTTLCLFLCIQACGLLEQKLDQALYKSIIHKRGTLYASIGKESVILPKVTVEYSNSDASTLLVIDSAGNYIYVQGPAIIFFDDASF